MREFWRILSPGRGSDDDRFGSNRSFRRFWRFKSWRRFGRVQFPELLQFGKEFVSALRFGFVNLLKREAHVDKDVVAQVHLRRVFQADLFNDSAKIRFTHPDSVSVGLDFEDFSGNG
jgi:hypothetical protein